MTQCSGGEMAISYVETSKNDPECKNLLKKHINFFYCLLLYPYSVVNSTNTGYFELRTNCIQKACCIFLHSGVFMFSFLYVRKFTITAIDENPDSMFFIAEGFSEILRCFAFLTILWLKKNTILEALPKFNQQLSLAVVVGIYLLQAFIIVRAVGSVIMFDFIPRPTDQTKSVYLSIVSDARYILLFEPYNEEDIQIQNETTDVEGVFLVVIYSILLFSKEVLTQSADSLFFITSVTAFLACHHLKSVVDRKGSKVETIRCFEATKSVLDSINEITALYVLAKFLTLVPMFSGNGFYVFTDDVPWTERILFISYIVTSFTPFLLAAEAHYLTNGIVCPSDPEADGGGTTIQLTLIHGYRFFTITYGFLGSISVIVVTYAILVLQFNMSTC